MGGGQRKRATRGFCSAMPMQPTEHEQRVPADTHSYIPLGLVPVLSYTHIKLLSAVGHPLQGGTTSTWTSADKL